MRVSSWIVMWVLSCASRVTAPKLHETTSKRIGSWEFWNERPAPLRHLHPMTIPHLCTRPKTPKPLCLFPPLPLVSNSWGCFSSSPPSAGAPPQTSCSSRGLEPAGRQQHGGLGLRSGGLQRLGCLDRPILLLGRGLLATEGSGLGAVRLGE